MSKAHSSPRRRTLRVLRAERDLTQGRIAEQAGLTQTRYWQIEHGQGAPVRRVEKLAIARTLAVPPQQIDWPAMTLTKMQIQRADAQEERLRRLAGELRQGDRP